jgi:hypothetical protein
MDNNIILFVFVGFWREVVCRIQLLGIIGTGGNVFDDLLKAIFENTLVTG